MDLGLALQALSLRRVALKHHNLNSGPQEVPKDINDEIASKMLKSLNFSI